MRHFEHPSALVIAPDGHEFFVDSAPALDGSHAEDFKIAQALCGFAFDMGRENGRQTRYVGLGAPISGFEGLDSLEREIAAQEATEAPHAPSYWCPCIKCGIAFSPRLP